METYTLFDVLPPWIIFFSLIGLIGYAEDWIHKHFFGIGYLLTKDSYSATRLFYVFFSPGIFIHEVVQYLVAGALNIPINKVVAFPEPQPNGTLRLNFVVMKRQETTLPRAMLFSAMPFVVMGLLVWFISTHILDLHAFTDALGSANPGNVWRAVMDIAHKPDFVIWFFLLFTIANTMLPNKADAEGLPLIGAGIGIIIVVMIFFGIEGALLSYLAGPVANTLALINSALVSILVLDILAIGSLWLLEGRLESWTGIRVDYSRPATARQRAARQPGSDEPLPIGTPLPSIYSFDLPLPDPTAKPSRPQPTPVIREPAAPARPTLAGQFDRQAATASPSGSSRAALPSNRVAENLAEKPAPRSTLAGQFDEEKPARATGEHPAATPPARATGQQPNPFGRQSPESPARATGERPATTPPARATGQQPNPFGRQSPESPTRPIGERPAATGEQPTPFRRPESPARPTSEQPPESSRTTGTFAPVRGERPSSFSINPRPAEKQEDNLRSSLFGQREKAPIEERPARPTGQVHPPRPVERPTNPFHPAEKPREERDSLDALRNRSSSDDDFNQDVYEEDYNQDSGDSE